MTCSAETDIEGGNLSASVMQEREGPESGMLEQDLYKCRLLGFVAARVLRGEAVC